jgi:putative transposase
MRKQLALYQERRVKPRRPDPATRVVLVLLSRLLDWRALLTVVQPDTLVCRQVPILSKITCG